MAKLDWRALLLIIAMLLPSVGVYSGMYAFPDEPLGQILFFLCKLGLLTIPLVVFFGLDKNTFPKLSESFKNRLAFREGMLVNVVGGMLICAIIYGGYRWLAASLIDVNNFREQLDAVGMTDPKRYLGLALYWTFINALLEEYFWRWYAVQEAERYVSKTLAVFVSAFGFVLHHVLAMKIYFDWTTTLLCASGVFIGGLLWSISYSRYRSVWPGYVSHVLVDAIIFYIGWELLFS